VMLFIDGYNFLRYLIDGPVREQERTRFIHQLERYARIKGHCIIVVFDGGFSDVSYKEKSGSLTVMYSGVNKTADDVLLHELSLTPASQALLISNDRALNDEASKMGIVSLGVGPFHDYLSAALATKSRAIQNVTPVVKTAKTKNATLDELMQSASVRVKQKKEDLVLNAIPSPKIQGARGNRRLLKIVTKL
jgi:hypothetical protein